MTSVFISHVKEDEKIVVEIAHCLEEEGFNTWYFERDSLPGPSYLDQTRQAITSCSVFMILISPSAIGSRQVHIELVHALQENKLFLPILIGISHEELSSLRPEWGQVIADSASIVLPEDGCRGMLAKLVKGLEELAVASGGSRRVLVGSTTSGRRAAAFRWKGIAILIAVFIFVVLPLAAILIDRRNSGIASYNVNEVKWHPEAGELSRLELDLKSKPLRIDHYAINSHKEEVIREAQIIFDTEEGALYQQGYYLCVKIFIPAKTRVDQVDAQWKLFRRTSMESRPNQVWHHEDIDGERTKIEIPSFSVPAILSHIVGRLPTPSEIKESVERLRLDDDEIAPRVFLGMTRKEWEFSSVEGDGSALKLQITRVYAVPYSMEWLKRLAPLSRIPTTPARPEWSWGELEIEEYGDLSAPLFREKLITRLQAFATNYDFKPERTGSKMRMSKYETAVELLHLYR